MGAAGMGWQTMTNPCPCPSCGRSALDPEMVLVSKTRLDYLLKCALATESAVTPPTKLAADLWWQGWGVAQ